MSIEVNATEQIIEVNATGSTIDINVTSQTVDVNATTSVIDVNVTNGPGPGVPDGGLTGQVLKKQSNTDYDTYWAADTAGVPYVGATGNVDLGEYELKAGQLTLDTTPTGTASVGTTRWNDTIGSSETTLKGGSVILKNGVDLVARVVNKVTPNTTLTKAAYQAVRISGAQGQRLAVAFAQANNDNNSADTIGLVTETIATNQEGFIMTVGNLEDINTTGSLQGETWADGDVLYLSPTVAGAITNIKPVAPQHLVVIGYVEYAHANHGKIYVKVMNGWELGELHDVDTTGATAGQVLKYNGTIWTPSSDLDTGITSLNGLTALTQTFATGTSGTDFNISSATSTHTFNLPTASATNRGLVSSSDWSTFNAKIGGTLATGQVAFGSAANTIAGSNNLFWDNTNGRLGIGTNAPANILSVTSASAGNAVRVEVPATNLTVYDFYLGNSANTTYLRYNPQILEFRRVGAASTIRTVGGVLNDLALQADGGIAFYTNGANERMRLFQSTGNLLIQNGGTFTDGGQRLQVQGDAFIKGSGNTFTTNALAIQNSDSVNTFRFRNDNYLVLGSNANAPTIAPMNRTTTGASNTGGGILYSINEVTTSGVDFLFGGNPNTASSGANTHVYIAKGFAPTSGTATFTQLLFQSTINQTGGANGITRGLYVNPALTAAADWRSIEWSNNSGWGLYGAGTANNYIAGNLGIGTTTLTGYQLRIFKNLTGSTTSRIVGLNSQINSDVTDAYAIQSNPSIQDAVFTTYLKHFSAENAFKGASATLQEQIGFYAAALSNGTNNYGFFGAVTSGTNRWNLYMNGTANNYMAGDTGVGTATLGTATKLTVGGSETASSAIARGTLINTTLTASANNDVLVGLDVNPTFTNGAYTGVTNYSIRAFNTIYYLADGSTSRTGYLFGTYANNLSSGSIVGYDTSNVFSFTPGSGNATYTGFRFQTTINQSGTATGITRGIWITPTLTAAADWRSIEMSNNSGWGIYQSGASANNYFAGKIVVGTTTVSTFALDVNGTARVTTSVSTGTLNATNWSYGDSFGNTKSINTQGVNAGTKLGITDVNSYTGTSNQVHISVANTGFAPTSGTGTFIGLALAHTVNQTGTATGITRGLFVTPILTAAADWRSIEWTNNTGWGLRGAGTAPNFISGNTIIGGSAVDGGQKLQVNGTSILNGLSSINGAGVANVALAVYANGTGAGNFIFQGFDSSSNLRVRITSTGNFRIDGATDTGTSGDDEKFRMNLTFSPTSGTRNHNGIWLLQTINQTGGANGITRGLYINPTLTAAADWRSIETSNNSGWAAYFAGSADLFVGDGADIQFGATNGTKLGTATSQKIGFWNATPIVQPTTAVAGATRVGGGGTNVTDTDTFDGYTIAQVVKALRNAGLLA